MKHVICKKESIYFELLRLLVFAALISGTLFFVANYFSEYFIGTYYDAQYQQNRNSKYITKLQQQIQNNDISTCDSDKILGWVRQQKVISVQIYKDNIMVFDSQYPDKQDMWQEKVNEKYYDWETYYNVDFADGEAVVSIFGLYIYQVYTYIKIAELILVFILFLLIVMLGIRKTIRYLCLISNEIEILEGGNLDYEITISGKNELSELAKGLNDMRRSFKEHIEMESHLVQANRKIITEMSHDLRTPLTSIMIYAELLLKGKYQNEQQMKEYVDKINKKTYRLKQLTDHLFEYALVSGESEVKMDTEEKAEVIFYDLLSEMCGYMEEKGIQSTTDLKWENKTLRVCSEYISRIFDNITSNIVKYADYSEKVYICIKYDHGHMEIMFKNRYNNTDDREYGTNIGIENVKNMMKQMNGVCKVEKDDKYYAMILLFPCK